MFSQWANAGTCLVFAGFQVAVLNPFKPVGA